jgi:hypothetical protein
MLRAESGWKKYSKMLIIRREAALSLFFHLRLVLT